MEARRDAEEKARQHREEVLREGQRAYNEEVRRRRDAEKAKKEAQDTAARRAAGAAAAARAGAGVAGRQPTANFPNRQQKGPTPTPDDNLRGYRDVNARGGPSGGSYSSQQQGQGIGRTFTVGGDGKVRSQNVPQSKPEPAMNSAMPKPHALNVVAVGSSTCEVDWKMKSDSRYTKTKTPKYQFEFQWRLLSMGGALGIRGFALENWQQATKLISVMQVRKKNLKAGGHYEFRVRAVEELEGGGGVLGDRSMWSESLKVMLKQEDFQPQTKPTAQAQPTAGTGVAAEQQHAAAAAAGRGGASQHPIQHPKATPNPSAPRASGGPLGGGYREPSISQLEEEFELSDEDNHTADEVEEVLSRKGSAWQKQEEDDPLKRTNSIFDKTFYHKVYVPPSLPPSLLFSLSVFSFHHIAHNTSLIIIFRLLSIDHHYHYYHHIPIFRSQYVLACLLACLHLRYSFNSTGSQAREVASDNEDDDDEEAHEVNDDLDFDKQGQGQGQQDWEDQDEVWFDLHPPKHNMIKCVLLFSFTSIHLSLSLFIMA
jgi:hypothetical protein